MLKVLKFDAEKRGKISRKHTFTNKIILKMKKQILFLLLVITIACSKKNDPVSNLIDPKDSDKLMEVIITPAGGEKRQGDPPKPSAEKETLKLEVISNIEADKTSEISQTISANQGSVIYSAATYGCNKSNNSICEEFRLSLIKKGQPFCVFRIEGASYYYVYAYPKNFGNNGNISFPFTLPENIGNGSFKIEFSIVDEFGLATNYIYSKVNVKRLEDKDNPAKAYGCNFEKGLNELLDLINKLNSVASCELVKSKYNDLVNAMLNCKDFPEASKTELRKANQDMQAIDCSVFNNNKKEVLLNIVKNSF